LLNAPARVTTTSYAVAPANFVRHGLARARLASKP